MDSKQLFEEEVKKCGDQSMAIEERRVAYSYFLRGLAIQRHEVGQLRDLERSYTHQLGEMLRLCDVIMSWIFNGQKEDEAPDTVIEALKEVEDYIRSMRLSEESNNSQWVMHILGPDDVYDCRGEFDAMRKANQHNRSWARLMAADPKPNDPYCVAVAVTKDMMRESVRP